MRANSTKKLLRRLEWVGLILMSGILHLMPLDLASGFMGKLWEIVAPRTKRQIRAKANLLAAYPEINGDDADKIMKGVWNNLGRVAAETVLLDRFISDKERVTLINPEIITHACQGGNAVFVTMHSGNWELVGLRAGDLGIELAGVYQALSNPLSEAFLMKQRVNFYRKGLFSKGHDTARKLIAVLRSGGSPCFVADVRDKRGVKVQFFNQTAKATHIPALLARNSNRPLIAIRSIRTKGSHFEIEAVRIPYPVTKDKKADSIVATQAIHDQFEDWIREKPTQWMWILKKWA
ncbi:lysophospholipid acyltransferase family protein [Flexibacterium corallicola]|uniref:lysophospholipid acyltransferase family protein n=1 Tax=Flexibacterium corallicola TaxID=3037259 RepID=UPI00286F6BEF|nr:lipid A biosynthesis acyltransferase [Pseudovibrio sp. M1P-2-3]